MRSDPIRFYKQWIRQPASSINPKTNPAAGMIHRRPGWMDRDRVTGSLFQSPQHPDGEDGCLTTPAPVDLFAESDPRP